MRKNSRCLFDGDLKTFIEKEQKTIFGNCVINIMEMLSQLQEKHG